MIRARKTGYTRSAPTDGTARLAKGGLSEEGGGAQRPTSRSSNELWAPAAYRFIGQVLQALGIVSLLQGSLDITLGLEQALSYYYKLRDLLLLPGDLLGIAIPSRYADLWIVAAVFHAATSKSVHEEDKMISKNFFGSLALFYPFVFTSINLGRLVSAAGEELQAVANYLSVPWLLAMTFALIYFGFLGLWIGLFSLIGAFSTFYWPIVAIFPFAHKVLVSACNRLAKFRISPWLSRLPLAAYGPGVLVAKLSAILSRQPLPVRDAIRLQHSYWQQLSSGRVKNYYTLLMHYAFGSLLVLLLMKLFIDTAKIF